jgi:hypothetical protein
VQRQRAYVGGGLQPGAALVVARLAVVTLPPRSTVPTVAGCRLVGCSVVSRRPLRSCAVAGVSQRVCVGLGPVLASRAPSPPWAAAAAWRWRGRVPIAGWSLGGVGPDRGLGGGGKTGVGCGVGQERLGPSYFFISLVLGPLNSLLWSVPSSRNIGSSLARLLLFVSARTNKRHHHHHACNCNATGRYIAHKFESGWEVGSRPLTRRALTLASSA